MGPSREGMSPLVKFTGCLDVVSHGSLLEVFELHIPIKSMAFTRLIEILSLILKGELMIIFISFNFLHVSLSLVI